MHTKAAMWDYTPMLAYLSPDTSDHALPSPQPGITSDSERWKAELTFVVGYTEIVYLTADSHTAHADSSLTHDLLTSSPTVCLYTIKPPSLSSFTTLKRW